MPITSEEQDSVIPPINKNVLVPLYGQRQNWVPRTQDDYGDGGAFPEIHVAQYPLDMGRKSKSTREVLGLNLDGAGKIKYDAIVTVNQPKGRKVFSHFNDLAERRDVEEIELARPSIEEQTKKTEETKEALEKLITGKIAASQPTTIATQNASPQYIRYTPSQQGPTFNSGAKSRIIRMVEMPKDPLEPPKFKSKKVPKGPSSPPVPIMHSPPRKVTVKDMQDWKIPPCVSNWKNAKGYTIPLDKRLAADGRGLTEVTINDKFAKLSQSLYVAERNAREEVEKRAHIQRTISLKEKEKKEAKLRWLAQQARMERAGGAPGEQAPAGAAVATEEDATEEDMAIKERNILREDRKRDRERDRRLENKGGEKKSKLARDEDRDVSEKIALGVAAPGAQEVMFDQRLFNQTQGLGDNLMEEDTYNVYDKPLFHGTAASQIYRPKQQDAEFGGEDLDKMVNTSRFVPDRDFEGVDRSKKAEPREGPVQFEREEEADPFGLDQFLQDAKKGKNALDKIGSRGLMNAAGGSNPQSYDASNRSKINFEQEKDTGSKGTDSRRHPSSRDNRKDRDRRDRR